MHFSLEDKGTNKKAILKDTTPGRKEEGKTQQKHNRERSSRSLFSEDAIRRIHAPYT